jgi:hypothetical protein
MAIFGDPIFLIMLSGELGIADHLAGESFRSLFVQAIPPGEKSLLGNSIVPQERATASTAPGQERGGYEHYGEERRAMLAGTIEW